MITGLELGFKGLGFWVKCRLSGGQLWGGGGVNCGGGG